MVYKYYRIERDERQTKKNEKKISYECDERKNATKIII